jgi:hypothetical protein
MTSLGRHRSDKAQAITTAQNLPSAPDSPATLEDPEWRLSVPGFRVKRAMVLLG